MKYGLNVPNFGPFGSARTIAALAAAGEAAGWDGVFIWDHVVRREGDFDLVDPWIALAAAAVATQRVALGPLVTPLPRRRPWNVAKAAVSLDHLSGGRAVLGIGLGTPRGPEFSGFGEETDLRRRGDMLDEGLAIVRAAWSGEPVHADGAHYHVDGIRFLPRPVRPEGIPIWGATESARGRPIRRAAALAGIVPLGVQPEDLTGLTADLRAAGAGPDFDVVVTSDQDDADRWQPAGATWWLRNLSWEAPLDTSLEIIVKGPQ